MFASPAEAIPNHLCSDWITANWAYHSGPPVPSLFTFNIPANAITKLMGISVEKRKNKNSRHQTGVGRSAVTDYSLGIERSAAILKLSAWGARELVAKTEICIYSNCELVAAI